jgi:phage/plasmid-like protein (TIGR03299 family)
MAHNLNSINGKVSFMSVKEKAWHGLGQILENPATSEEAIQEAGLDFTVEKEPVYVPVRKLSYGTTQGIDNVLCIREDGKETLYNDSRIVPDRFATFRTDNGHPFGIVGSRYEIVQNRDAFAFFDAIVGEGEAIYETAGALGDGETIFITAKLPSYIQVGKGVEDAISKYLLLTSTHDGSGSIQAMFTPIRVVCNNTLNAALRSNASRVTIRHTKSVHDNLKKAHTILGITNALSEELASIYNNMTKVRITDKQLLDYIETVVLGDTLERMVQKDDKFEVSTRSSNIMTNMTKYAYEHPTQLLETTKGTAWGAYNAVTGYYQNVKSYKGEEEKMSTLLMGSTYDTMQKSFVLAQSF